ncbi:hypothetical protein QNN00_24695 [Bacillus velezensis]|nr:hypothetical protein [Bacillus velezensis]
MAIIIAVIAAVIVIALLITFNVRTSAGQDVKEEREKRSALQPNSRKSMIRPRSAQPSMLPSL